MPTEQPPPEPAPPKRRRGFFRRWLRRLLITLGVPLVLFVGWWMYSYRATWHAGQAKLQPMIAELDVADPDWRAADLCGKRNAALPPPEANAAEIASEAAKLIPASYEAWHKSHTWLGDLAVGKRPHPNDLAELAPVLTACRPALERGRAVRRFPTGGFSLTYSPVFIDTKIRVQDLRQIAGLFSLASLTEATGAKGDAAVRSAMDVLAVARAIGDEPLAISQLVRMALVALGVRALEQALGLTQASPEALAEWTAMAEAEERAPRFAFALRGERAGLHGLLEHIGSGEIALETVEQGALPASNWQLLTTSHIRKHIPDQQAMALKLHNSLLAATQMPYGPARVAASAAAVDEVRLSPKDNGTRFVRLVLPALDKLNEADFRVTALLRCSVAAAACERYRLKTGQFPKSLAEVPKDILPTIPEDPYTATPIRYQTTATGAVVYCVGQDGVDNRGKLTSQGNYNSDVGITLLEPKHRRQPPKPKDNGKGPRAQ